MTRPQRRADALITLVTAAASMGTLPASSGGLPVAATVTIGLGDAERIAAGRPRPTGVTLTDLVRHGSDPAALATTAGGAVTLGDAAARFALCCSDLTPTVVDDQYRRTLTLTDALTNTRVTPLAMGRATRLATAAQRKALAVRDKGCAICNRPPRNARPTTSPLGPTAEAPTSTTLSYSAGPTTAKLTLGAGPSLAIPNPPDPSGTSQRPRATAGEHDCDRGPLGVECSWHAGSVKITVARVVAASAGRDRVLDATKAFALVCVVVGHSLAWHITDSGAPTNVLEVEPRLVVLTWLFQVLPLFFAAGAVSNAASFRAHGRSPFLAVRTLRLVTPVLVYTGVWTLLLLPFAGMAPLVGSAGSFLSQLLWFAGVYLLVVAAVPLTIRWIPHPLVTTALWFAAVAAVDVIRISGGPDAISWLNLLLVWGLMHQIGYHLPRLRQVRAPVLMLSSAAAIATALTLAAVGPYSGSLISVGTDTELSNLAPPSIVLALYGLGQILLLAALWPLADRALRHDRLWAAVAVVGARGMGIYLWHIPVLTLLIGAVLLAGWQPVALSPAWWLLHLVVVALVIPGAWLVAGVAASGEARLQRLKRRFPLPPETAAVLTGLVILNISVTGFATWWGPGMLGLPACALVNLVALVLLWQSVLPTGSPPKPPGPVTPPAT